MAYNPNIPQAGDIISQSQAQILQNFQEINTLIGVNHIDFSDPTNEGKHKFVTMPEQGSDPVTGATELALYAKHSIYGQVTTELFIRDPSNGGVFDITSSFAGANGWTFLSSGLLMMWGFGNATGDTGNVTITQLPGGTGPVFSAIYYFSAQSYRFGGVPTNDYVQVTNFTATTFRLFCSERTTTNPANVNYRWLAIGAVA